MRFPVRIYRHKDDYSAMVPDWPGCVAAGDGVEEVCRLISEAITMHLDLLARSGQRLPKPSHRLEFVIDANSEDEEFCTWVDAEAPATRTNDKRGRYSAARKVSL